MRRFIPAWLFPLTLLACGDGAAPARPAAAAATTSNGPIIQHYPGESPGPPYYALLGSGFAPTDAAWVGIVFVRAPECVPAGFNLLTQFDRPTALGCTLTVEGDAWFHNPPVPPPFRVYERGTGAVPVYFVASTELQAAIADGVLTIGELQALPSLLLGYASFLEHVVHNTSDQNHGHETLVAHGALEDGRTFQFRYNEKFLPETDEHVFPNVKISFE